MSLLVIITAVSYKKNFVLSSKVLLFDVTSLLPLKFSTRTENRLKNAEGFGVSEAFFFEKTLLILISYYGCRGIT